MSCSFRSASCGAASPSSGRAWCWRPTRRASWRSGGVPFVLTGLYFIAGRFFIDAWARRRTVYGLTDRRALILKRVPGGGLTAVDMANAQSLRLKLAGDGSGLIEFGQPNMFGLFGARSFTGWSPALSSQPAFIALPDAAAVYRQVEQARAALGAGR